MPNWKLTIDGTEFSKFGATTIKNIRPENNISSLEFAFNDYESRAYSDMVSKGSQVQLDIAYKTPTLHTTFIGEVVALNPVNNPEVLTVYCEGFERAYKQTYCNGSFGVESANPTKFTPREIIQDLTAYYVEFSLDTANPTNWTINDTDTYVDDIHNGLSVTNITSKYLDCFTVLNRLCDVTNAYAQTLGTPEPGIHWYAEPYADNPRLFVKEICDDHSTGDWDRYYGGSQTAATVIQGFNLKNYSFHQTFHDFANNVILACAFRKPASDTWTEYRGAGTDSGSYLWDIVPEGALPDVQLVDDNTADLFIVGNYSLLIQGKNGGVLHAYYPSAEDAGWNFENVETVDNPPTLNFYYRKNDLVIDGQTFVRLFTTDHDTDYFEAQFTDWSTNPDFEWIHVSLPIGNYWRTPDENRHNRWVSYGSPDWADINGIDFKFQTTASGDWSSLWVDDLHFAGKLVREARDAGAIDVAGDKERQVFLRLDTALDDSFNTTDNTGTAARLAASELFKRSQFQTTAANIGLTGTVVLNGLYEDLLPGQQLHVHAGKRPNGTYRYNLDMRIKQLTHSIIVQGGYSTSCEVTSDLWNSHTFDTPSAWGIYRQDAAALGHAEARDLKASGVDIGIPRLTWDPTA